MVVNYNKVDVIRWLDTLIGAYNILVAQHTIDNCDKTDYLSMCGIAGAGIHINGIAELAIVLNTKLDFSETSDADYKWKGSFYYNGTKIYGLLSAEEKEEYESTCS